MTKLCLTIKSVFFIFIGVVGLSLLLGLISTNLGPGSVGSPAVPVSDSSQISAHSFEVWSSDSTTSEHPPESTDSTTFPASVHIDQTSSLATGFLDSTTSPAPGTSSRLQITSDGSSTPSLLVVDVAKPTDVDESTSSSILESSPTVTSSLSNLLVSDPSLPAPLPDLPDLPGPNPSVPAPLPSVPAPLSDLPVHILLLTEGRSGSTWLSSFFWAHPDVYFLFEPFFSTPGWRGEGCEDTLSERARCVQEVLSRFWKCDLERTTGKMNVLGRYPSYHLPCSGRPKLCSRRDHNEKAALCMSKSHRVAKTIRLWDLASMASIMESPDYDVRVIHLVRDPRPLVKSRSSSLFGTIDGFHKHTKYTLEEYRTQSGVLCERMVTAARLGDNPPSWLEGRYMRVRHEDMSVAPVQTARALYEFTGLPWTVEMEKRIGDTAVGEGGRTGYFGVARESAALVGKWKREWGWELIETVTEACYETIQYLGYETDLDTLHEFRENEGGSSNA